MTNETIDKIKRLITVMNKAANMLDDIALEEMDIFQRLEDTDDDKTLVKQMDQNIDDIFFASALSTQISETLSSILDGTNYIKNPN